MIAIDADIHLAKAIVIDGNSTSRSVLSAQLKDLGVQNVRQVSRLSDARHALEQSTYDIVISEVSFEDGGPLAGQGLLDELRRENLLPYSTVYFIVTGEATYANVVEAGESTIDSYLIKPYSCAMLGDRLTEARRRKRSLKPVYAALEKGDLNQAALQAQTIWGNGERYAKFAAQVAAELWLRSNEPAKAKAVYAEVLKSQSLAWAETGQARARVALGDLPTARRLLESQVKHMPEYADAHDLLARVLVELGEFEGALESFRTAAALTPACLLRQQYCGTLAFYQGREDEALRMLERSVAHGRRSRLFDVLTLVLLAVLRFDMRDGKGLAVVKEFLRPMQEAWPDSVRLLRIALLLDTLFQMQARNYDLVLQNARQMGAENQEASFDLEAATLTLLMWTRIPSGEVPAKEWDSLLRAISLRYCVSKAITEVLVVCVRKVAGAEDIVRKCQAVVNNIAETALNRSLAGDAEGAVSMLIDQGESTGNAKLIDMAAAVTRRHAKAIENHEPMLERIKALQQRFCAPVTHIAGIRRTARYPGGVVLRA